VPANDGHRAPLKRLLETAFTNAERPSPALLTADTSLEASVIRNYLAQRTWCELDNVALENYDTRGDLSALPFFLSSTGFVYFLPALLLFIADRGRRANLLVETVLAGMRKHAPAIRALPQAQRSALDAALSTLKVLYADDPSYVEDLRVTGIALSDPRS
jgi:hypothetical protein